MKKSLSVLALLLSSCASVPHTVYVDRPVVKEVPIPVAVPCKITAPDKPQWMFDPWNVATTMPVDEKVKRLIAENQQRGLYEEQLELAIQNCQ